MKKIISLFISLCMVLSLMVLPVNAEITADTSWYNTTATEFTIDTPEQFTGFGKIVAGQAEGIDADSFAGKTVTLGADIDFNGNEITPVGAATKAFSGTFDGGNHVIKNVKIVNSDTVNNPEVGLFARVKGGTIKNIGIEDIEVVFGYTGESGARYAGALVGCAREGAVIEQSYARNVTLSELTTSGEVSGALIGQLRDRVTVKNCYAVNRIIGENVNTEALVSGFIGLINQSGGASSVENCYAGKYNYNESYAKIVGAVRNAHSSATVNNVYYDTFQWVGNTSWAEQTVGTNVSADVLKALADINLGESFVVNDNEELNNGYPLLAWEKGIIVDDGNDDESPDTGTTVSPDTTWYNGSATSFELTTKEQFAGLAQLVAEGNNFANKTVSLGADIDFEGETIYPVGTALAAFSGVFDGNGHIISNVKVINSDTTTNPEVALFARLKGGAVKNLGITDIEVSFGYTGDSGTRLVGGLVAHAREGSVIDNCFVRSVTFSDIPTSGEIVGALVGQLRDNVTVKSSYAVNRIIGENVHTEALISGLIGFLHSSGAASTVENCYAGKYNYNESYAKIVGAIRNAHASATVNNVYYDTFQWVGNTSWADQAVGTNVSSDVLKSLTDIELGGYFVLNENADYNFGYPALEWEPGAVKKEWNNDTSWFTGTGEYIITTDQQLASIAKLEDTTGSTFKLGNDIDMSYAVFDGIDEFSGVLDGQGYEIKNLRLSAAGEDAGLVKTLNGTIKNTGFVRVTITGDGIKDANNAAAIAAVNNGTIEYCYVKDFTYSGTTWRVGTLAAHNRGNINHCYVINLDISGAYNGGKWNESCEGIGMAIARTEPEGVVSNCYVGGKLNGSPSCRFNFGYIVDGDASNITNCYTTQYWQGSLLNPSVKVEGNYTYYVGKTLSVEQLQTIKHGWCELDGFAVDYYGLNGGYPIFEKNIPVCDTSVSTDVMAVIPDGGKVVSTGDIDLNIDTDKHIIISGGNVSGAIKAASVEITDGANVTASIEANDIMMYDAEVSGAISGTGKLDMTDYTGNVTAINGASGFETVHGPKNVKVSEAAALYLVQYDNEGRMIGMYNKDMSAGESVDLSAIDTTLESSANTKVFIWKSDMEPLAKSYVLRDEYSYSEPLKVLILGNSITWHSPAESLDWDGARGMAASSDETDYVHVLDDLLSENLYNVEIRAENIAALENYWVKENTYLWNHWVYKNHKDWKPDVIINTIGANMMNQVSDKNAAVAEDFVEPYRKIMDYFAEGNEDVKVIACTTVITNDKVVEAIEAVAAADGYTYVDGRTGLTGDQYLAKDASNSGVAAHPNDAGMAALAQRLFDVFAEIVM